MINAKGFSPCQRKVKKSQELSERGLIHDVHHAHLCDEEVEDAASGGHCKHVRHEEATLSYASTFYVNYTDTL